MLDEIYGAIRGISGLGLVIAVDDSGPAQMLTVHCADGVVRDQVEVMQIFGFASMPPSEGAICLVLAVGGDPANLRALPVACPAARMGNLSPGDSALYAQDGTRVHVKSGGDVEIWAKTCTIHAPDGGTIDGNLHVTGTVAVDQDVTIGSLSVKNHDHTVPQGGATGPMQN